MLYPAYQQRQIHELLAGGGTPSEYVEIDSPHGHDTFLINLDQVAPPIAVPRPGVTADRSDRGRGGLESGTARLGRGRREQARRVGPEQM